MTAKLDVQIARQPDDVTCGPTCLQAVYRYYGSDPAIAQLVQEVRMLDEGGTLAVFLANHALENGYRARIYTFNLQLFDPSWFGRPDVDLAQCLKEQAKHKPARKLQIATQGYLKFLQLGGELAFADLTAKLLRRYLRRGIPILTGLSSTCLYRSTREIPDTNQDDAIRGEPAGHFVVISGYDKDKKQVHIADPWPEHPYEPPHNYDVTLDRLINAILLGAVTYDSNLLIITPANH
ncbi:MAG: C39 family peptidase [Nevskiales bacterium]